MIGSRAYRPGDPISTIDWSATARLSAATGRDEFVVRERRADDAPRVALVLDRRPSMRLFPAGLPWLSKPDVVREAVTAIVTSAAAARAELAVLDFGGDEPHWLPPSRHERVELIAARLADRSIAPEDTLARSLSFLGTHRTDLPGGSFVFLLSDFLVAPSPGAWLEASAQGWDLVPVLIQDPTWEQSFPDVAGVGLPIADPATGSTTLVRLGRREVRERRLSNRARIDLIDAELLSVGLRPVRLASTDTREIDRAFVEWAEERRYGGGTR